VKTGAILTRKSRGVAEMLAVVGVDGEDCIVQLVAPVQMFVPEWIPAEVLRLAGWLVAPRARVGRNRAEGA